MKRFKMLRELEKILCTLLDVESVTIIVDVDFEKELEGDESLQGQADQGNDGG